MKAIKVQSQGKASIVSDAPVPKPRDDYLLVKVHAVGLNPTDWKHIDYLPQDNATVGCDYAGEVVSVGPSATKSFSKGDRVAGFVHGVSSVTPQDGAFGEYVVAKADVQMKIPSKISYEEAATLGVSISTVGQGLYQSLGLPQPGSNTSSSKKEYILIYGGATGTGLFAMQYAKLSGLTVVTTCSPKNFDLVKSYGADAAFDYSDAKKCAEQIKEYTNNSLRYVFDCISEKSSPQICADALASDSKDGDLEYSSLLPVQEFPRKDVKNRHTLAYTITNEAFKFAGQDVPASQDDFEFAKKFWTAAEGLMQEGKVRVPPLKKGKGFEGVMEGLDLLRNGKVSGEKLTYTL